MKRKQVTVFALFIILVNGALVCSVPDITAQDLILPPGKDLEILAKTSNSSDRGGAAITTGDLQLQGNYFLNWGYWGGYTGKWEYKREQLFGDLRGIALMVGIPPGVWGRDIPHRGLGIVDRSMYYNVFSHVQNLYGYYSETTSSYYSDWEARDFQTTRGMGGYFESNMNQLARTNMPETWPEGYYGNGVTWAGLGEWHATPGERRWPGKWAEDIETGKVIAGKPRGSVDYYFAFDDKYAGILATNTLFLTYPVGLDWEMEFYAYSSPLFNMIVYWNGNLIYQKPDFIRANELRDEYSPADYRRIWPHSIDSVYVGFFFRTRIPYGILVGSSYDYARTYYQDTYCYLYENPGTQAFIMYHRWGKDLQSRDTSGNPVLPFYVANWGFYWPRTPNNIGITAMHYFSDHYSTGLNSIKMGDAFTRVEYAMLSGKPEILINRDINEKKFFHPFPAAGEEPNYKIDNIDSMESFHEINFQTGQLYYDPSTYPSGKTKPQNPSDLAGRRNKPNALFMVGSGPFTIMPGDTIPLTWALFAAQDQPSAVVESTGWPGNDPVHYDPALPNPDPRLRFGLTLTALDRAKLLYKNKFQVSGPPVTPKLWAAGNLVLDETHFPMYICKDGKIRLYWDDRAETTPDVGTNLIDFEGYRLWKRLCDPNLNSQWQLLKQWDVKDGITGWDTAAVTIWLKNNKATAAGIILPQNYYLGDDTGIEHYYEESISFGIRIDYAITAYDKPDPFQYLPSQETMRNDNSRYQNYVHVTAGNRPLGYVEGDIAADQTTSQKINHLSGLGTGSLDYRIVDEMFIKDSTYTVVIKQDSLGVNYYNVFNNGSGIYSVTKGYVYTRSLITSGSEITNYWPVFNGIALRVINDDEMKAHSNDWTPETISVRTAAGAATGWSFSALGAATTPIRAIYELRYEGGVQDSLWNVKLMTKNPAAPVKIPFTVWNITNPDSTSQIYVSRQNSSSNAFSTTPLATGDPLYFFEPKSNRTSRWLTFITFPDSGYYKSRISIPANDTVLYIGGVLVDTTIAAHYDTVLYTKADEIAGLPRPGDKYRWSTMFGFNFGNDPQYPGFAVQDTFTFTTKSNYFNAEDMSKMFRIRVVPNPYVAYTTSETDFYSSFMKREIIFVNLPEQCTIDIYTVSGEHIHSITHNPITGGYITGRRDIDSRIRNTGIGEARWDLLTKDNYEISYGVYIYVVKTFSGQKHIGKFLIIK